MRRIAKMRGSAACSEGWGSAVIPRLAHDLHNELPEEKGFSERNIKRMLAFYREYPQLEFVPQAAAQIRRPGNLPAELQTSLPSIEQIESELQDQDES